MPAKTATPTGWRRDEVEICSIFWPIVKYFTVLFIFPAMGKDKVVSIYIIRLHCANI